MDREEDDRVYRGYFEAIAKMAASASRQFSAIEAEEFNIYMTDVTPSAAAAGTRALASAIPPSSARAAAQSLAKDSSETCGLLGHVTPQAWTQPFPSRSDVKFLWLSETTRTVAAFQPPAQVSRMTTSRSFS